MLPEHYRELLTAYVDGELSSRQRRHAARLLQRSAEARNLLRQLQEDAKVLRHLPRAHPPEDLTGPVLETIRGHHLTPPRRTARTVSPALPAWTGLAAAAVFLSVLAVGSYLYFSASLDHEASRRAVARQRQDADSQVAEHQAESERDSAPMKNPAPEPPAAPPAPAPADTRVGATVPRPPSPSPKDPGPTPAGPDRIVTAPALEMFELGTANVHPPVILKVHELEQESVHRRLLEELGKDNAFRMELPCKDGTRAFERLQVVLKSQPVTLLIDEVAQGRLKKQTWKTNYVLYAEDLAAEEWARLLRLLGGEDRKAGLKRPAENQFDRLVVTRMTGVDRKELSDLLGAGPGPAPTTRPPGPLGTDPRKPLTDLTAEQVAKALEGQGRASHPQARQSSAKVPERQVLALAYNPVRPRPGSPEVKRFLEGRNPGRPGTVEVLLVLRGLGR